LRLTVVFVAQSGVEAGGAERSLQLLLSNLPPRVRTVVVLFGDGPYADELRQRGFRVEIVDLPRDLLGTTRETFSILAGMRSLKLIPELAKAFKRLTADVIYTNTVKAHLLGGLAGRLVGTPVVMHLRDILEGRARVLLRTIGLACTVQRIAISNAVAKGLALPNTAIVPNPLELSEYESCPEQSVARALVGLPQSVPLVAILGRINRWKGHDRFLRIAKLVTAKSNAHFVIVGKAMFRDADFADELPALAAELGIADRVHFVPWLEDPRIAYAAIDVNCNTSHAEPFGRTIIEAAACGVPTVAFDEGGAPEAIEDGISGHVVPAGDEAAFAGAILGLIAGDREQLAVAARAHARLFDAKLHAERVTAILDRVVSSKRNRKTTPQSHASA
jgi:glycosyltransferase involved in cell wall biosynthesis